MMQILIDSTCKSFRLISLTAPNYKGLPTCFSKCFDGFCVAFHIGIYFLIPESNVCFRSFCTWTVLVTMPETTVNEYDFLVFGQDDVWRTRQPSYVEPITIPFFVKQLTDDYFRLCVATRNLRHNPAAFLSSEDVRHLFASLDSSSAYTLSAMRAANKGGTAFPICFAISIFVPVNMKSSGNDCNLAASR